MSAGKGLDAMNMKGKGKVGYSYPIDSQSHSQSLSMLERSATGNIKGVGKKGGMKVSSSSAVEK